MLKSRQDRGRKVQVKRWIMELDWNHWSVLGAPVVLLAGVVTYFLMRRHKEKPPTDHIYK